MKKLLRLLIASVVLMAIGGIIILATYFSKEEEIAELNSKFSSTIYELSEPFSAINVNATDGSVYVQYGDNTRVTIDDNYLDKVSVKVDNGVLCINQEFPEVMTAAGWDLPAYIVGCSSEHKEAITITVPESLLLNKAEFSMGKGDVRINGLSVKDLQVQVGIGSFSSNAIKGLQHYVYQVPFGTVDFGGFIQ